MLNLLTDSSSTSTGSSMIVLVIYIVIIGVAMYFFAVRPQKKEQKRMQALINSVEVGDTVLTTSGFYGVVIDLTDEDCIVEFGNNKNCRIPMKKSAISEVEKAGEES
ncbi:MAG: preprotein translocase subunit YajC [Lachnospiraceae bacterium]|nr:preprotein translocase subunit YajC [Lachnospiraceae bacterium]